MPAGTAESSNMGSGGGKKSASQNSHEVYLGRSSRLVDDEYRNYKWHEGDPEGVLYANIINFKRSNNPRGVSHHCVMCGDKNASIPSQNKDVCKICDTGFWLLESRQIVVKFCKGCKNFAKLWEFRDKPEATKCIKCRQRGRLNYFSKKAGEGDDMMDLINGSSSSIGLEKGAHSTAATLRHLMNVPVPSTAVGAKDFVTTGAPRGGNRSSSRSGSTYTSSRPARSRSRTLDFSSLEMNSSSRFDFVSDHELNDAASVLLATSTVRDDASSRSFSEELRTQWGRERNSSPRAALLDASFADTTAKENILDQPLSPFAKAVAMRAAVHSKIALPQPEADTVSDNKRNQRLLQLAELTERVFGAPTPSSRSSMFDQRRGRDRSNTLDLGSLGTAERGESFLLESREVKLETEPSEYRSSADTDVIQMKSFSSPPIKLGSEVFTRPRSVSTTTPEQSGDITNRDSPSLSDSIEGETKPQRKRSITSEVDFTEMEEGAVSRRQLEGGDQPSEKLSELVLRINRAQLPGRNSRSNSQVSSNSQSDDMVIDAPIPHTRKRQCSRTEDDMLLG